jgi:hypothetical protein
MIGRPCIGGAAAFGGLGVGGLGAARGRLGGAPAGGLVASDGAESGGCALFRRNSRSASKALSASATRSCGLLAGPES